MSAMDSFHNRVEELTGTGQLSIEEAIAQAAWEADHPGESATAGGTCGGCEKEAAELIPWASQRLCWDCVDLHLDLLALAVAEGTGTEVMVSR